MTNVPERRLAADSSWSARTVVALAATVIAATAGPALAQASGTAAAPRPPSSSASATPATFDAALNAYERGHHGAAFDDLATLADAGDARAARIALLMQRHGPKLYGRRFDVEPARRRAWLDHAAPVAPTASASR